MIQPDNNNNNTLSSTTITSKLFTSLIELTCHSIITIQSLENNNEINRNDNNNDNDDHTLLEKWEKRMNKIKFDFNYFWKQIDIQHHHNQGRLHFYSVLMECYEVLYETFHDLIVDSSSNDADNINNANNGGGGNKSDEEKWNKMLEQLKKLHSLCSDPKSNTLMLPKMVSEEEQDDNGDEREQNTTSCTSRTSNIPSQESKSSSKSGITTTTRTLPQDDIDLIMKQYEKDYNDIQTKLQLQECIEPIRYDLQSSMGKKYGSSTSTATQNNITKF